MERRRLRKHQRAAYSYAAPKDAIALFMAMRLGKSLVFTRWAKRRAGLVLIVTPATTAHVWQYELKLEGLKAVVLRGSSKQKLQALKAGLKNGRTWFITNPEGVRACPAIAKLEWSVVGCDETGGWLTNPASKISKIMRKHFNHVPSKAILTGLPDPSGPEDYVEQLMFTFGSFMGFNNFWKWRQRFMLPGPFGWIVPRYSRRKIRSAVRKLAFRMTAKQAGVYVPKVYSTREVEAPPSIRKCYKQVTNDYECNEASTKWATVAAGWLQQLAGGSIPGGGFHPFKVREVVNLLSTELKGTRVIVWARFIREIKEIQAALKKAGIRCGRISGLTKTHFRPKILQQLEDGKLDAVVIQGQVGQFALNLSFADTMIFYSNFYDWGIRGQCEERCSHFDKKTATLIIDLVTRGTIDEAVLKVLKGRKRSSKFFARMLAVTCNQLKVA